MSETIALNFHLKGRRNYAFRAWPAVPRVGDVVMLHDPDKEKGVRYPAIVRLVVWAGREESWAGKQLECDVFIEWAENEQVAIPWMGGPDAA